MGSLLTAAAPDLGHGVSPLGCLLDRMMSVDIQGKLFNITVIQVYAPTSNAEEEQSKNRFDGEQRIIKTP